MNFRDNIICDISALKISIDVADLYYKGCNCFVFFSFDFVFFHKSEFSVLIYLKNLSNKSNNYSANETNGTANNYCIKFIIHSSSLLGLLFVTSIKRYITIGDYILKKLKNQISGGVYFKVVLGKAPGGVCLGNRI